MEVRKMEQVDNKVEQQITVQTLTAADRCDVCGAQAYVRAILQTGDLVFCAHHGAANKEKIEPIAIYWQDETSKIS
jgi:hypothetical protein